MAAGILAIGFAFIAGMFPVGVRLTAIATEQTIAPIVADEATAKIKLYGELYNGPVTDPNIVNFMEELRKARIDFLPIYSNPYVDFADALPDVPRGEFAYPSTDISPQLKKYNWSALCRRVGVRQVHVVIFVSRKAGAGAKYRTHNSDYTKADYGQDDTGASGDYPVPVKVLVNVPRPKRLEAVDPDEAPFFNAGCTIVDDATGSVYRVLKRTSAGVIRLDRKWEGLATGGYVWVVPPAEGSGRNPCVRVDPTHTIRF